MKDQVSVIVAAVVLAYAAVRIYQKYIKKDKGEGPKKSNGGSSFPAHSADDDYEPYSKKE
jgi:hypothetical protein